MSQPENDAIRPLARHDDEPVFDEPWQAQALGLALTLSERGVFTPTEWSQTLGAAHRVLLADGSPDTPKTYYEAVAAALERLLAKQGGVAAETIEARVEDWRAAYLNTPHGQPVQLSVVQKR